MSPVELIEWMIYEAIEPFGDRRSDIQTGRICAILANIHRSEKTKPYKITDFIPDWDPPPPTRQQTPEEQLQMMLMIQAAQNAKVNA